MVMRVLTLCGYVQNASILSKRMGALRKTCKDVEFGERASARPAPLCSYGFGS
jgi:hypothetical protein